MSDDILRRAARALNDGGTPFEQFLSGLTLRGAAALRSALDGHVVALACRAHPLAPDAEHDDSAGACERCYVGPRLPLCVWCATHERDDGDSRHGVTVVASRVACAVCADEQTVHPPIVQLNAGVGGESAAGGRLTIEGGSP